MFALKGGVDAIVRLFLSIDPQEPTPYSSPSPSVGRSSSPNDLHPSDAADASSADHTIEPATPTAATQTTPDQPTSTTTDGESDNSGGEEFSVAAYLAAVLTFYISPGGTPEDYEKAKTSAVITHSLAFLDSAQTDLATKRSCASFLVTLARSNVPSSIQTLVNSEARSELYKLVTRANFNSDPMTLAGILLALNPLLDDHHPVGSGTGPTRKEFRNQ